MIANYCCSLSVISFICTQ